MGMIRSRFLRTSKAVEEKTHPKKSVGGPLKQKGAVIESGPHPTFLRQTKQKSGGSWKKLRSQGKRTLSTTAEKGGGLGV